MSKLSRFMKKVLDKNTRVLVKEGVLSKDLEVTQDGMTIVVEHLLLDDANLRKSLAEKSEGDFSSITPA